MPVTDIDIDAGAGAPSITAPPPPPPPDPIVDPNLPTVDVATDDFDPDLLKELGDVETDPVEYGDDLQADVGTRLQKILQNGLKKEAKEELLKKYPFPKMYLLLKPPL